MKYNSVNDAARDAIDNMVKTKGLDPKDYPYSSDIKESLNQIATILDPNVEPALTIADAFANLMDAMAAGDNGAEIDPDGK